MSYKTFNEYIPSQSKWFDKIPKNWDIRPIKHLAKTIPGGTPSTSNLEYWENGNIPWLPSGMVQNCQIDETDAYKFITEKGLLNSATKYIGPNSILVALTGATCANIGYLTFKATANQSVISVEPYTTFPKYIYYALLSQREQILDKKTGGAQSGINEDDVKNIFIPTMDFKEQQQIANYLDKKTTKIDATIAKNEELIQLLEEKRVALINQVITKGLNPDVPMKDSGVEWIGEIPEHWDVDCLKHNVILNAKTLTDTTDNDYEFYYVDIGSVSLENGIEKYEHMSFEDAPSRARRVVKKDDVIISTVRTYLKAIAIIPDKEDIIVSTGFAVLTPNKIDSRYLGYMVKTEYFTNLVSAHSVGVSYPAINSTDLVNLDILIPPNNEQKQIADYLDNEVSNINDIITKVTENINLLEEYKTSLIHHVVTGKIDVRGEEI